MLKGDPRKKTALAREIRALAAQIPDEAALDDFAESVPAGPRREAFLRAIRPLLKFRAA